MPSTPRQAVSRPAARRRRGVALGVAALLLVAVLVGGAYLAAVRTSLFAVRTVDVTGAQPTVVAGVEAALEPAVGTSLVSVDPAEIEARVESLPTVRSARVDRRFPHTLAIEVVQERPVAVARLGEASWLVAASGRVLSALELGQYGRLPRIWLADGVQAPAVGAVVGASQGAEALRAVAQLPAGFPARVQSVRGTADELVFVLGGRTELRLGPAVEVREKLAAAATVLEDVRRQRIRLAYLDVSLPERPVGAPESQVEGQA